ncbi:site-specific integrase [Helicobacter cetorum]|uniref:site-specific integrase n=1 Tax=Helicobacter cetorum TaxID=138563 RepID=UPI000CF05E11|nr:site-specific integrase [Helicobacter cetorum]
MRHTIYLRDKTLYLNYTKESKRYRTSLNKLVKSLELDQTSAFEYLKTKSLKAILRMLENLSPQNKGDKATARAKKGGLEPNTKNTNPLVILNAFESFLNQKIGLKETSLYNTRLVFNSVLRLLGLKEQDKLSKITKTTITNYHKNAFKTHKKNTLRAYNALLKSFLAFCETEGFIEKSPYFSITLKNALESKEIEPFNLEEIKSILKLCPTLRLKAFLMVAFFTGMRTGEELALTWEDIDFQNKKINIDKSLNTFGKITSPKNKSSVRKVDLLEPVAEILKELKAKEPKNKKLVFLSMPKRTQEFQDAFKKLLKALNLKYRKLYTTRHTFASLMLSQGEEPMWVSKMMGHKDLNITYSTYSHFIPQQERERAAFLKGAL